MNPHLLRMVTDGLHDTIDAYLAGTLPLHRLAWELRARLGALAELTDLRTLNRLHAHTVAVECLVSRSGELTREHDTLLAAALAGFRATLDALTHTPTPTPTHRRRPATAA